MNTSRLVLSCGCNQNCLFCDAAHSRFDDRAEMVADGLASDALAGRVNITGGEPTLDPRLTGLIKKIKRNRSKYVAVLTNGLKLASEKYLRDLEAAGLDEVVLSFFEPEAERYDFLADAPGAFAKKTAAMENLGRSKIKTTVNLLVYSGNQSSVSGIMKMLCKKYGIKNFAISVLEPDCERVAARPWLVPDMGVVIKALSGISRYRKKPGICCMVPANGAIPRCVAERLGIAYPDGAVSGADVQERVRIKPEGVCSICVHKGGCAGMIKPYAIGLIKFLRKSAPHA